MFLNKIDFVNVESLMSLANQGDRKSQLKLAIMYANGCGVAMDKPAAIELLKQCLEPGEQYHKNQVETNNTLSIDAEVTPSLLSQAIKSFEDAVSGEHLYECIEKLKELIQTTVEQEFCYTNRLAIYQDIIRFLKTLELKFSSDHIINALEYYQERLNRLAALSVAQISLLEAIKNNEQARCKELLLLTHPNFVDDLGFNPLHYAVFYNQPGVVIGLLSHSHIIEHTINSKIKFSTLDRKFDFNYEAMTVLHYACLQGYVAIIQLLVESNKVDINETTANHKYTDLTALHLVIDQGTMIYLFLDWPGINENFHGEASADLSGKILLELLKSKAIDVNVKASSNLKYDEWKVGCFFEELTPLHLCVLRSEEDLFDILLQDARTDLNACINVVHNKNLIAYDTFPGYFPKKGYYNTLPPDAKISKWSKNHPYYWNPVNDEAGHIANGTRDGKKYDRIYRFKGINLINLAILCCDFRLTERLAKLDIGLNAIDSENNTALHVLLDTKTYLHKVFQRNLSSPDFSIRNNVYGIDLEVALAILLIDHGADIDIANSHTTIRTLISNNPCYSELQELVGTNEAIAYDSDTEMEPTVRYKSRLFLGEADFSYTKALIKKHKLKHPDLAKAITATEFQSEQAAKNFYLSHIEKNIQYAKEKGAAILFGVDATKLEQSFPKQKFDRIHFNCPYVTNPDTTRRVVYGFFNSAKNIQDNNHRIHISLVDSNRYFWQGFTYGVVDASASAGYQLIKKRRFGERRYPGYGHKQSMGGNREAKASPSAQYAKEFIFEKTDLAKEELLKQYGDSGIIQSSKETKSEQYYFAVKTDDDSSDYISDTVNTP